MHEQNLERNLMLVSFSKLMKL